MTMQWFVLCMAAGYAGNDIAANGASALAFAISSVESPVLAHLDLRGEDLSLPGVCCSCLMCCYDSRVRLHCCDLPSCVCVGCGRADNRIGSEGAVGISTAVSRCSLLVYLDLFGETRVAGDVDNHCFG